MTPIAEHVVLEIPAEAVQYYEGRLIRERLIMGFVATIVLWAVIAFVFVFILGAFH
jgi:hypothetical protein